MEWNRERKRSEWNGIGSGSVANGMKWNRERKRSGNGIASGSVAGMESRNRTISPKYYI